jgi:hypothetical protein
MQNKANFKKVKLSVNKAMKKDYEQMDTWSHRKNKANSKPKQTQKKQIFLYTESLLLPSNIVVRLA